jgi:2-keto-4-pentenoate hydratase
MVFDPAPAAAALYRVRTERGIVGKLPAGMAPSTEAEGAAVQYALARLFKSDPPFGFKIGATGKRMQDYLGIGAPIAGFMQSGDVHWSEASIPFGRLIRPGVECEVAVRLRADLPPGPCSLEQALDAVGEFVAGIELVENRYSDVKELGAPMLVADQMYHLAAVVGTQGGVHWRALDIDALQGSIHLAGGTADSGVNRPARPSAERPGAAGGFRGRRRVRWIESGPGGDAGQRHAADLAHRPDRRDCGVPTAAAGDAAPHIMTGSGDPIMM